MYLFWSIFDDTKNEGDLQRINWLQDIFEIATSLNM